MTDTALTIITDALLDLGVLADEETPTASQAVGGLRKLNNMLESWGLEDLMLYGDTSYVIPFVIGKQIYTIGPGGDFNIPYPDKITGFYTRDTTLVPPNTLDIPLEMLTDQEWQDWPSKTQTAQWPNWGVWVNDEYPLKQAFVTPIPSTSQYALVMWVNGPLGSLTLNQAISLPPGYKRALTANLALELGPSYEVTPSPVIAAIAQSSKAAIKVRNFQLNTLQGPGIGQYDVTSNRVYVR
jgi:hypothetical protein